MSDGGKNRPLAKLKSIRSTSVSDTPHMFELFTDADGCVVSGSVTFTSLCHEKDDAALQSQSDEAIIAVWKARELFGRETHSMPNTICEPIYSRR